MARGGGGVLRLHSPPLGPPGRGLLLEVHIGLRHMGGRLCGWVWCGMVWYGVVWCGVVWCGVPKVLLPEGNGQDVYPLVQVNGRVVCVVRARCVSVWFWAVRGGVGGTWTSSPWRQSSSHGHPMYSLSLRLLVHG